MTREEAIEAIKCNWPDSRYTILREALDMAISALRQQEHFREVTKKVEPLTLDELREMDGEPVWVVWPDGRIKSQWLIVGSAFWIDMFVEWDGKISYDYGNTWLAYRQNPEEDDHE